MMKEIIKRKALELGFCAVRVTSAESVEEMSGLEGRYPAGGSPICRGWHVAQRCAATRSPF